MRVYGRSTWQGNRVQRDRAYRSGVADSSPTRTLRAPTEGPDGPASELSHHISWIAEIVRLNVTAPRS